MVMSKYVKITEANEIPENEMQLFKVGGCEVLIVNVKGEFYALENRCPHMGYPLYLGSLTGKVLTCGFHYASFDVTSGKSLGPISESPLKTYKVKIENSSVLVELPTSTIYEDNK